MNDSDSSWFSVYVEARAPAGVPHPVPDESAADVLMDMLADHDGIVASGEGRWSATVSLEEPGPAQAAAVGEALIVALAAKAGMPQWPAARIEAVREDVLEEENEHTSLPALVSAPEAADILEVTSQRVHELAAKNPEFPKPVYELRAGKLWLRGAIEVFAERRDRKPGRPGRHELIRQRVISALLDTGITVADAKVYLGHDRVVVLQLEASGSQRARRLTAAKIIAALHGAGLDVTDEGSHSAEDMEAYLADGNTAEVFEIAGAEWARA